MYETGSNNQLMMIVRQVLSEVSRPRKIFAKSAISAMVLAAVLFVLVNVAYVR